MATPFGGGRGTCSENMVWELLPFVLGPSASEARELRSLQLARGEFRRQYTPPRDDRLKVLENLGTNNLGNDRRRWFFPAGSAKFQVWIVDHEDFGEIAFVGRSGKIITTQWVVKLSHEAPSRTPRGTLNRIIWRSGMCLKEPITQEQRSLFESERDFVGFADGRGPNEFELIYT